MNIPRFLILALFIFAAANLQAQELRVVEINLATDVVDREAVNPDTSFAADVGTVYCHSLIKGAQDTTEIVHVWYHKEKERARIPLQVASNNWRTWSSKNIAESWTGHWRIMIEGPDGNVLGSKSFTIRNQ